MNPLLLLALAGAGVAIASKPKITSQSSLLPIKPYWKINGNCTNMDAISQFLEGKGDVLFEDAPFWGAYGTYLFKQKNAENYHLGKINHWTSYKAEFGTEMIFMPKFLSDHKNLSFYDLVNTIYGIRYNGYPCFNLNTTLSIFLYALELYFTARTLTLNNYLDSTDFQNKIFKEIPDYLKDSLNINIQYDAILAIDFISDDDIVWDIYTNLFYYYPYLYSLNSTAVTLGFLYLPQFFMWDNYEKQYHIYDYGLKTLKNAKRFDRLIRNVDIAKKLWYEAPNKGEIRSEEEWYKYFPKGY